MGEKGCSLIPNLPGPLLLLTAALVDMMVTISSSSSESAAGSLAREEVNPDVFTVLVDPPLLRFADLVLSFVFVPDKWIEKNFQELIPENVFYTVKSARAQPCISNQATSLNSQPILSQKGLPF